MSVFRELPYSSLYKECDTSLFNFTDTSCLEPFHGVIGQERAVEAMKFGLGIKMKGYNIYMSGVTGTGKTSYAQSLVKEIAAGCKTPDDWCYVYNFDDPTQPIAINLPAGGGKAFQKAMEEFIRVLEQEISKSFSSEDYEREKAGIVKEYRQKRTKLIEQLNDDAEKEGFKVKTTNAGIYFLPVLDGKALNEEEFAALDEERKQAINAKSDAVQLHTLETIRKIRSVEKEEEDRVLEWDNKVALYAVGVHMSELKERYRDNAVILGYLDKVQEDILDNLDDFREEELTENQQLILPFIRRDIGSPTDKYKVNVVVDNSELSGAPVVTDFNPTYYNLLGKLEYENEYGTMITDYTLIKGGLFHKANGGYLILQAKDVLSNVQSWEVLKRILKTGEINIENIKEQMGLVAVSTLKPQPIPINTKVILAGSEYLYRLLTEYDEDFEKLFRIKADFDDEMERSAENIMNLARFVNAFCTREGTVHFSPGGVARVVEYASRLVEDQEKLTTRFSSIAEILGEAGTWAVLDGSPVAEARHVDRAIAEKRKRSNKYDRKLLELLKEGTIMIDTDGEAVGQINGLSILDTGDYVFGKPSRITAATYMGESGIVNIEREIEMSGTSHSKGVLILTGYIGQKYAQEIPLSLSASLCFEQLYNGIDGDSASSAELYAILSSLSGVPIKQGVAVTGSVNQKGQIQPIGGATYKIEGFFELCKERGLTGTQGVIIPHQNVKNLVLNAEVVQAVKEGSFHIYPVATIDEGIEILTGREAGQRMADGTYPKGTVNSLVYEKLKRFAKTVASFGRDAGRGAPSAD